MKTMWNVIVIGIVMAGCAQDLEGEAAQSRLTGAQDASVQDIRFASDICSSAAFVVETQCGVTVTEEETQLCDSTYLSTETIDGANSAALRCLRLDAHCGESFRENVERCLARVEGYTLPDCALPSANCSPEQQQVRPAADVCYLIEDNRARCGDTEAVSANVAECIDSFTWQETVVESDVENVIRCLQRDSSLCSLSDGDALRSCIERSAEFPQD